MKANPTFKIHTRTSFGFGMFKIKAKDFNSAFKKLSPKDKQSFLSIEDEDGNEKQSSEFIN